MTKKPHRLTFRHLGPSHPAGRGYAKAVKADARYSLRDPVAPKEMMPVGWGVAFGIGLGLPTSPKVYKERGEGGVKRCLVGTPTLGPEPDLAHWLYIYISHRVKPRLAQSASLVPGNFKAVVQKGAQGLRLFGDAGPDEINVGIGKFWFAAPLLESKAKVPARIAETITTAHGFTHQHRQRLHLGYGRIVRGSELSSRLVCFHSPCDVREAMLAGQGSRAGNVSFLQKQSKVFPHYFHPAQRKRVRVAGIQIVRHPLVPMLHGSGCFARQLGQGVLRAQPARGPGVAPDPDLEPRGPAHNPASLFVPVTNPPVRALGALVETGHL